MPAAGAAEFLNILAPACLAAALGKVFGMTIHLDITEDVQFLPLWRERFSSAADSVRASNLGHILAAIQLLDCQRTRELPGKQGSSSPTRMSGADQSTGTRPPVNPLPAVDRASTILGWIPGLSGASRAPKRAYTVRATEATAAITRRQPHSCLRTRAACSIVAPVVSTSSMRTTVAPAGRVLLDRLRRIRSVRMRRSCADRSACGGPLAWVRIRATFSEVASANACAIAQA